MHRRGAAARARGGQRTSGSKSCASNPAMRFSRPSVSRLSSASCRQRTFSCRGEKGLGTCGAALRWLLLAVAAQCRVRDGGSRASRPPSARPCLPSCTHTAAQQRRRARGASLRAQQRALPRTSGAPCTAEGTVEVPRMARRSRETVNLSATLGSSWSSTRCDLRGSKRRGGGCAARGGGGWLAAAARAAVGAAAGPALAASTVDRLAECPG